MPELTQTAWLGVSVGSLAGGLLVGFIFGKRGNVKGPLSRLAKSADKIVKLLSEKNTEG